MNIKYIITIILFLILIYISNQKNKNPKNGKLTTFPYKQKYLLTKTEYNFYKILKNICEQKNIIICPKVRLEDFIEVNQSENKQKYRGYIKSRHVDFLLCDTKLYIKAGIELDDISHNSVKAQETDELKNNIFKAINIPLYRIKTNTSNYITEINNIISNLNI